MPQPTDQKKSFKDTLNLPKTAFAMKANLVQNEPASLKRWAAMDLYARIRAARTGRPKYVFHDGPPYANGSIHLGHLLNKVLKDFVVRSRTMAGYDCPYVPGWDCHGLPIEHKVMQDLAQKKGQPGDGARDLAAPQIRQRCADFARKFIKLQAGQMQRLLTLADYEHPYLTMDPAYEAAVLEVFADMVDKGLVYRALKPVHWSVENRTALAEAELEYYDREDTSVYVLFEVAAPRPNGPTHLMIWTTTPWTLPANMAVAVHERYDYGIYDLDGGRRVVMAAELANKVLAEGGASTAEPCASMHGRELVGLTYRHPFIDRIGRVVCADYVTLDDGTGLVHTAPGHGVEDYQTGLREGLNIYCPVCEDGTFDNTVPDWLRGKVIWEANDLVVEHLRASGHLFHAHTFTHSYPHDWRGKTPVIFRATEQWFVGVDMPVNHQGETDTLRQRAMTATATDDITFIPAWGRNRMRGMLESRPDWCLSRQRAWGLPIPAFYPPEGVAGEPLLTQASVLAVGQFFRGHGSDAWFKAEPRELLAGYDPASDEDAPRWVRDAVQAQAWPCPGLRKSTDIFDVWFESGSSWHACMQQRGLARPDDAPAHTDLYLEGSDQHRGWFQLSLLPSLAVTGKPPFSTVLTHGFMVDKHGGKMSKSLGNALEVEELLKDFGADVCRWWTASLNADNDIKVDLDYFKVAGEQYRKVRNTLRFLLSNLYDFDPARDRCTFTDADAASIDAWALGELRTLTQRVTAAYEGLIFRDAQAALFHFCNDAMSAVYLAAAKDRLYCDRADSPRRRRTQTAMFDIADALVRLLAPLLPHTADEAWASLHAAGGRTAPQPSVHLAEFPQPPEVSVHAQWSAVMAARDGWLKAIEDARARRGIDNPLDVGVEIADAEGLLKVFDAVDLADLCGVSRFAAAADVDPASPRVVDLRDEPRCERSWKRDGTVRRRSSGDHLSDRDAAALSVA